MTSERPRLSSVNAPYRLPPPLFNARCKACWFVAAVLLLVLASFWTLKLQWSQFLSLDALRSMGRFLGEFFPPDTSPAFLRKVLLGTWETLAMSALGTALAAAAGLLLALPASRLHDADAARARVPTRLPLNALRAIPELVWAVLLLVSAGLGPFSGTLALAAHTTGVLGRCSPRAWRTRRPGRPRRCAPRAWATAGCSCTRRRRRCCHS
jgi:phosphonate transport system permease protein